MKTPAILIVLALALALGIFALRSSVEPCGAHSAASGGAHASCDHTAVTPRTPAAAAPDKPVAEAAALPPHRVPPARIVARDVPLAAIQTVFPSLPVVPANWRSFEANTLTIDVTGEPIEFTVESLRHDTSATTWTGRSKLPGSSLVAVATKDGWSNILRLSDGQEYTVNVSGDNVRVAKTPTGFACGVDDTPLYAQAPAGLSDSPAVVAQPSVAADGLIYVDVAFSYAEEAEKILLQEKGAASVELHARAIVASANAILAQSQITNFEWRYVGDFKVPNYPLPRNSTSDDSVPFLDTKLAAYTVIQEKRNALGADLVVMFAGPRNDSGGLAEYNGYSSAVWAGHAAITYAHEWGHNFGCRHDRVTDNIPDGGGYHYGHTVYFPKPNSADPNFIGFVGDIMSYFNQKPYFSNPNLEFEVGFFFLGYADWFPTHAAQKIRLGIAAGDPKAAHAARWMSERASTVASWKGTIVQNPAAARIVNLSTRSFVDTGSSVQIAGIVVKGSTPKQVLIRASGPSLAAVAGLAGCLIDPVIEIHGANGKILDNDDWSANTAAADAIAQKANAAGAFIWARGTKDAAVLITLDPGNYTAIVSGKNGGTGVALVEAYEVDLASSLTNISTRALVKTGADVEIAGFVIEGIEPKTVLIRASGPGIAQWVSNALPNPVLELHKAPSTKLETNDDWSADATKGEYIQAIAKKVGAFDWTWGSLDAAMVVTLEPGGYTAIVSGKNNSTGVALVEVYEVN